MFDRLTLILNWSLIPLLIIGITVTLSLQLEETSEKSERSAPPERADYFIRGARLSTLGLNGKLLYQIQAEEILHYPDRSAAMTDMTLHYQGGSAGIWQLHAGSGRIPPDGGKLELQGDVVIRGQRPNEGITQMKMSEVQLFPEKGILLTESAVSIIEPGSLITAVGMEADILRDIISLSKDVQVQYAW